MGRSEHPAATRPPHPRVSKGTKDALGGRDNSHLVTRGVSVWRYDCRTFAREPVWRGDRIGVDGRRCTYVVREKDAEDRRQGPKDFRIHCWCRWRLLALSRRWRLRTWGAWVHEGTVVWFVTGRRSCERRRIATTALSWTRQRIGVQTPPDARVVCTATDVRRRRDVDGGGGGGGSKKYMYDNDANKRRWCDKNKNAINEWTRSRRTTVLIGIYYSNYYYYRYKLSDGIPYKRNVNLNQWARMKNGEVGCLIFSSFFPLFSPFFPSLRHIHTHTRTRYTRALYSTLPSRRPAAHQSVGEFRLTPTRSITRARTPLSFSRREGLTLSDDGRNRMRRTGRTASTRPRGGG